MLPKIATDIPAMIIVVRFAPSQTMRSGASADFWQTVQDDQIRLQDFRKLPKEPEKDGDKKAEEDYQDKTDQGFVKSHSDMTENTAVTGHFQKTQGNPGKDC